LAKFEQDHTQRGHQMQVGLLKSAAFDK